MLDLDELDALERRLPLFSVNRPNVVALYDRDHFEDDGRSLKEKAVAFCAAHGVEGVERVVMLAQLRFLGYVFNPVSFYWCYRADGELACMIAELNNTFGERLPSCCAAEPSLRARQAAARLARSSGSTSATATPSRSRAIPVRADRGARRLGPAAAGRARGKRQELTNRTLAASLLRYPAMPMQVIGLIHWQALKLWLKRVPFHRKPPFVPGKGSVRA